jgi:hypothetical protein
MNRRNTRTSWGILVALLLPWLATVGRGQEGQPAFRPAKSPREALDLFKKAVEDRDLEALSNYTAGAQGQSFRQLVGPRKLGTRWVAGPLVRARQASERLDRSLANAPFNKDQTGTKAPLVNPFAASLNYLADVDFHVVKDTRTLTRRGEAHRIRYGPADRAQEETVEVVQEKVGDNVDSWRVGMPIELARHLPDASRLQRHLEGLDRLAMILEMVAEEIEQKKLDSREKVGFRLLELFEEEKLGELLK